MLGIGYSGDDWPNTEEEAFALFQEPVDAPDDCHRHCKHWVDGGECCDCGEESPQEAVPVSELFQRLEERV